MLLFFKAVVVNTVASAIHVVVDAVVVATVTNGVAFCYCCF